MLKVQPINNNLKIKTNYLKKNKNIIKQQGSNLLKTSLLALSIIGLSSINSCTKNIDIEPQKTRQIDTSLVKKDSTDNEENFINITVDDSLDVIEHEIVL